MAFLASNGVDTSGVVRVAGAPTGVAVIAVDLTSTAHPQV
jgi:sugar/nucleoside kinase (ribokinase family)